MVTVISIILTVINLAAAIVTTEVPSPAIKPQATFAEIYYDYLTTTPSPYYFEGQTVTFSLHDNSGTPLSASEWIIVDTQGRVVRRGDIPRTDRPLYKLNAAWDQKNGDGKTVPAGVYTVMFPQTPNKSSAPFTILPGKHNRVNEDEDYFQVSSAEI